MRVRRVGGSGLGLGLGLGYRVLEYRCCNLDETFGSGPALPS